jgi:hypothetical protein
VRGSKPPPSRSSRRGPGCAGAITCSSAVPAVTARARREPGVAAVMRTQRGPLGSGLPLVDRPDLLLAKPDQAGSLPAKAENGAGQARCGVVRDVRWDPVRTTIEWQGSGTAGKYDVRGAWWRRHQLDPRARLDPGDARLVGKGRRPAPGVGWESKPLRRCLVRVVLHGLQ